MKCQKCGINIANHHKITEINGERFEEHLCSNCAREGGHEKLSLFNVGELFNSFIEPFETRTKKLYCENCLTTFDEFLDTGFVGCEHCYVNFKPQMDNILKEMQAGTIHKGRRLELKHQQNFENAQTLGEKSKQTQITLLQEKLKQAVQEERYEDAASLKKQLDALKEGM